MKEGRIHKRRSLFDSYIRTRQCWQTSKEIHTLALHGYWMQSRGSAKSDGWSERRERERERIWCYQCDMMIIEEVKNKQNKRKQKIKVKGYHYLVYFYQFFPFFFLRRNLFRLVVILSVLQCSFALFKIAHFVRQWSRRPGFNPRSRHTKDLIPPCLTLSKQYKVGIESKVEQSREMSSSLSYTSV